MNYRIEVFDNGTWQDSGEGPWDSRWDAENFATSEVGVQWRITSDALDSFTESYIETALWASTSEPFGTCAKCAAEDKVLYWNSETRKHELCADCSGEMAQHSPYEPPLDENYTADDIAPDTLARMIQDCSAFQTDNSELLEAWYEAGETSKRAGHDFWLTRERHGAGFWDRFHDSCAEGKLGRKLTDAAHGFGEFNLYTGDDGKIHN